MYDLSHPTIQQGLSRFPVSLAVCLVCELAHYILVLLPGKCKGLNVPLVQQTTQERCAGCEACSNIA